jgi:UDP-N-acetylmuramyl pentapeptide phosphotransferase/UDP-N-acetylglucosamine-1-phosphate transferase
MIVFASLVVATLSSLLTALLADRVIIYLLRWKMMDVPNRRSSHMVATPRGGGIAPVAVLIAMSFGLSGAGFVDGATLLVLAGGALALAAISLVDDVKSLSPRARLLVHIGVVIAAVASLLLHGGPRFLSPLIPAPIEYALICFGWIWFVNLFNFMDGIDGISAVELASIGIGVLVVVITTTAGASHDFELAVAAALIVGAGLGFLYVNWSPARVFMGDVGSVPLGFVAGGALLLLALRGQFAAAMILPAYYLVDATITLLERAVNRERLSEAHSKHAYQRAVRDGLSHSEVCLRLMVVNATLVALAVAATQAPITCTVLGYTAAFGLFVYFRGRLPKV